ncbi:hypothetical protein BB561_002787 [Smittium simulii]|uniref:Uncharacterized protein n=1 Tax=Smittium simulii TaxID=133385 RepID=A0A2T9YP16_9FUNG|nr:hypothetical protein BB561_002787 [Smittium simulii]
MNETKASHSQHTLAQTISEQDSNPLQEKINPFPVTRNVLAENTTIPTSNIIKPDFIQSHENSLPKTMDITLARVDSYSSTDDNLLEKLSDQHLQHLPDTPVNNSISSPTTLPKITEDNCQNLSNVGNTLDKTLLIEAEDDTSVKKIHFSEHPLASKFQREVVKRKQDKIDVLVRSKMFEKLKHGYPDFYPSSTSFHHKEMDVDFNGSIPTNDFVFKPRKDFDNASSQNLINADNGLKNSAKDSLLLSENSLNSNILNKKTSALHISKSNNCVQNDSRLPAETPRIPMSIKVKPANVYSGNPLNLRNSMSTFGFASDPMPKEIPHIKHSTIPDDINMNNDDIDIKFEENITTVSSMSEHINSESLVNKTTTITLEKSESHPESENEELICKNIDMLYEDLRKRQRETKRKPVPNALAQILSHNKSVTPEIIHDHNDPYKVEWIDPENEKTSNRKSIYYGEEALKLVNSYNYAIRMPFQRGAFNVEDYSNIEDILGDINELWSLAIEDTLNLSRKDFKNYYVVLAIPDLFIKSHVECLIRVLLEYMDFGAILVHQNSVLVAFGAGISNACVIDVGAQKTSIACVEDGYCLPDSR